MFSTRDNHPAYRLLGLSRQQRPLEAWAFGLKPEAQLDLLVMGAFHGDEPESYTVAKAWQHWLTHDPEVIAALGACSVMLLPCVNPDGYALATRKNAWQVDINRNWPTANWVNSPQSEAYHGGAWPASEPETQAVLNVMTTHRPKAVVSFHTPYAEVNTDGPEAKVAPLAQAVASAYGYPITQSMGYPTPGSFGSWAGVERDCPVLTVELAEKGCEATLLEHSRQALLNLLACL